ncbi:hypothetical protein [Winogradskyella sp.]|uniref:hypothetical protein n=1 Tax=Winogradskyella sp. TaxID=1883156 RepID=UPI003BAA953A
MDRLPRNKHIYQEQPHTVEEYILNFFDTEIDIVLGRTFSFSPVHLHRFMRAMLGEPIEAYITRASLEMTAKLLWYSENLVE